MQDGSLIRLVYDAPKARDDNQHAEKRETDPEEQETKARVLSARIRSTCRHALR